jgi:hypothetical protein
MTMLPIASRRSFLGTMAAAATGLVVHGDAVAAAPEDLNILGRTHGYSPQVGTLVSMLTWMRPAVTRPVKGMTQANLDYLFDANANSIGALLLHLAATETYYQMNTFDGVKWDSWPDAVKQMLGSGDEPGRRGIGRRSKDIISTFI